MSLSISNPISVRISGEGGQGNILMGMILSKALVKSGYWVVQTQHYTAQVRGGLSFCDVLFDREPIDYPKSETFNILYLMHNKGLEHIKYVKKNGILFYDDEFVESLPVTINRITKKILKVSASKIAYDKIGHLNVANMVGLGIIAKVTGIVEMDVLYSTMKENVKPSFYEMDKQALEMGFNSIDRTYNVKVNDKVTRLGRGFE